MIKINRLLFENLNTYEPGGVAGVYEIPVTKVSHEIEKDVTFVGFNEAKTIKTGQGKAVHFFIDDYRFNCVWTTPDKYIAALRRFDAVCAPDFSIYTDMPVALQIYNHYRKHWCTAYWQYLGINVIPTISWADERSFNWCFDGEPERSTVAISTVGTQKSPADKRRFLAGFNEMVSRLKPRKILCYGRIPDEIAPQVTPIGCFYDKFKKGVT